MRGWLFPGIDVRRLWHAPLVHPPFFGEFFGCLVPPDRARLALLLQEIGLPLHQLAHELGVLGNVAAAREHHDFRRSESKRGYSSIPREARAEPATRRYS